MPSTYSVVTTLEHLGIYGDQNKVFFGLILQVSADQFPASEAERFLLCPWLWALGATSIKLWWDNDGSTPHELAVTPVSPPADVVLRSNLKTVTGRLDSDYKDLRTAQATLPPTQQKGFSFDPKLAKPENSTSSGGVLPYYRWPAHLAQVTRYPYPIPHSLNLSFFFSVAADKFCAIPASTMANPVRFYAAPAFSTKSTDGAESFTPDVTTIASVPGATDVISISYIGPRSLSAQIQPLVAANLMQMPGVTCPVIPIRALFAGAVARPPLVAGDSLVRLSMPEQSNWQALLVPHCAELFDTSSRLIGALRDSLSTLPAANLLRDAIRNNFVVFLRLVFISLYRVGNLGRINPSNGARNTFFTEQFDIWKTTATTIDPAKLAVFRALLVSILPDPVDPVAIFVPQGASTPAWLDQLNDLANFSDVSTLTRYPGLRTAAVPTAANVLNPPSPAPDAPSEARLGQFLGMLEQLHLKFVQPEILSSILLAPWDRAVNAAMNAPAGPWVDDQKQVWTSFRTFLADQMVTLGMRSRVAARNLLHTDIQPPDPVIARIVARWDSSAAARSNVREQIAVELSNRFTADIFNAPFISSISAAYFQTTSPWITAQTAVIVPEPAGTSNLDTAVSQGITLVLDNLAPPPVMAGAADSDILRQTAGFCLLGRESGKAWMCLNIGVVRTKGDGNTMKPVPITRPTVIPTPLHVQDGMRQAMITYNNQPLTAISPVALFDFDKKLAQAGRGNSAPVSNLLLEYVHPTMLNPPNTTDGKIPGLYFGGSYEFAAGRVSNSGALPPAFAQTASPGLLASNITIPGNEYICRAPYKRTVPIGGIRFHSPNFVETNDSSRTLDFPPIPDDVYPFARERNLTKADPKDPHEPLLLLTSLLPSRERSSYAFQVAPPAIDLQTWDRYVAKGVNPTDHVSLADRIKLWADFYQQAASATGGSDLTLDDPAVTGVIITLDHISGPGVAAPQVPNPPLIWKPTNDASSLKTYRRIPLPITISVEGLANSASIVVSPTADSAVITVPPAGLYRFTLTLTLDPQASQRFFNVVQPTYTFLIETASDSLPTSAALRAAFSTPLNILGKGPSSLNFHLDLDQSTTTFRNISTANVETQEWRWNGRQGSYPFSTVPDPDVNPTPQDLVDWEVGAFATRSMLDATVRSMSRKAPPQNDLFKASLQVSEDISNDLGARYFRSRVIVRNRYGALSGRLAHQVASGADDSASLWTRTLVPARLFGKQPKPAIKLILPLTESLPSPQSDSDASKTASLLVVLQGPWYSIGGLGETLRHQIMVSSESGKQEAGRDPIEPFIAPGNDYTLQPLVGPVGHTFDTNQIAPRWVNSSFILPPPTHGTDTDLRNVFVKLQFKRVIDPQSTRPAGATVESEWTAPYWVQFLPSRLVSALLNKLDYGKVFLNHPSDGNLELVTPDGKTVALQSDAVTTTRLQHFLLLTEQVTDLVGRSGQERFVAICALRANNTFALTFNPCAPDKPCFPDRPIARIIEVQTPRKEAKSADLPPTADQLLDYLFPPTSATHNPDAKARIISLSPPIYPLGQRPCTVQGA